LDGSPGSGHKTGNTLGVLPSQSCAPNQVLHPCRRERSVVSAHSSLQYPLQSSALRDCRTYVRARAKRDITVPMETDVTSAISLYDISSSSRSTSASRNTVGSCSSKRCNVSLSALVNP